MALRCWILTDGRVGSENNARGLAEALGVMVDVFPVRLCEPWKSLSPWLVRWVPRAAFADFPDVEASGGWPDLLITAGRTPAVAALYVRRASRGKTFCVQMMKAGIAPSFFDLVVVPFHDKLQGKNVLVSTGALHRLGEETLAREGAVWRPTFDALKADWLCGLLVGGSTKGMVLDADVARRMIVPLIERVSAQGGKIIATCSRRTDAAVVSLVREVITAQGGYCWDGKGDNPYFGIMACSDAVAVTADSVSMVSEACYRGGRSVWMVSLGGENKKLARFHQRAIAGGHALMFDPAAERIDLRAVPEGFGIALRDMEKIASEVRDALQARGYNTDGLMS